jgi:hypothetical protein
MPPQQQSERRLISLGDEKLQQLPVRSALAHSVKSEATDVIQQPIALSHRFDGGRRPS